MPTQPRSAYGHSLCKDWTNKNCNVIDQLLNWQFKNALRETQVLKPTNLKQNLATTDYQIIKLYMFNYNIFIRPQHTPNWWKRPKPHKAGLWVPTTILCAWQFEVAYPITFSYMYRTTRIFYRNRCSRFLDGQNHFPKRYRQADWHLDKARFSFIGEWNAKMFKSLLSREMYRHNTKFNLHLFSIFSRRSTFTIPYKAEIYSYLFGNRIAFLS